MTKHVVIDLGHKDSDSGAVGQGFKEVDINYDVAMECINTLKRHNVKVTITTGSLEARCNKTNSVKPDCFVSVHTNAGGGDGFEVFVSKKGYEAEKIANSVYKQIVEIDKLNNGRGVKEANFYVLRNTNCPAILIETAFIDTKDIEAIDTLEERKEYGISLAKGILKHLGITYKNETLYKVCIGTYNDKSNADKQLKLAKDKGFKDAYIL